MWKKVWSDPVWSKVIATAIIGLATLAGAFLLGWWPAFFGWLRHFVQLLGQESGVPNWALLLLGAVALPTVLALGALLWSVVSSGSSSLTPEWLNYKTDEFMGLRWRWSYSGSTMSDLNSYCPSCDYQVFPHDHYDYGHRMIIAFRCDSCGRDLGKFEETYGELQSKAARFVQMKIRQNTWQIAGGA